MIGFIEGNRVAVELVEILGLTTYLTISWGKETNLSRLGFLIILNALCVDVFVFHCVRSSWIWCIINGFCMNGGALWLYEKLKEPVRNLLKTFFVFLVILFDLM